MDFRERCQEANRIDMVDYLAAMGYQPTKVRGYQYWYQSMLPDRVDGTASFKVNRNRNQWYDFGAIGTKKGGSLIDFAIAYHGWSISECVQNLSDPLTSGRIVPRERLSIGKEPEHKIIILEDKPIRSERLILYLRNRRIPLDVAQHYCREIEYQFKEKTYYSIGFKNDLGGYELRNEFYKNSSSPKGLTFINNGVEDVTSFEGFFDFLSFATIHRNQEIPPTNYLILNSLSFLEKALPILDQHRNKDLYWDWGTGGEKATQIALSRGDGYIDHRSLFKGYEDLNAWHCKIGSLPGQRLSSPVHRKLHI